MQQRLLVAGGRGIFVGGGKNLRFNDVERLREVRRHSDITSVFVRVWNEHKRSFGMDGRRTYEICTNWPFGRTKDGYFAHPISSQDGQHEDRLPISTTVPLLLLHDYSSH